MNIVGFTGLQVIYTAAILNDIDLPGFRLHPLNADMQDLQAIDANRYWRLTFKFADGDVYIANYEDYCK